MKKPQSLPSWVRGLQVVLVRIGLLGVLANSVATKYNAAAYSHSWVYEWFQTALIIDLFVGLTAPVLAHIFIFLGGMNTTSKKLGRRFQAAHAALFLVILVGMAISFQALAQTVSTLSPPPPSFGIGMTMMLGGFVAWIIFFIAVFRIFGLPSFRSPRNNSSSGE